MTHSVGVMDEFARIARLRQLFADAGEGLGGGVTEAIGDDCAVLEGGMVLSVDAQVEEVHFRRAWLRWDELGYRATMAALSDLAAVGARPICLLSALNLPSDLSDEDLILLARGQAEAARQARCVVAGGNLTRGPVVTVTTTVVGHVERPILRRGARLGDVVWFCGRAGLAALGLELLSSNRLGDGASEEARQARAVALAAFRAPRAALEVGERLGAFATAAIDTSDGLVADLAHLARASGVAVSLERLPDLPEARACGLTDTQVEALVCYGGEDYGLVYTAPEASPVVPEAHRIGRIIAGDGILYRGRTLDPAGGFRHFG